MRFRVYGNIKDSEGKGMTGVIIKLYLDEEEFQKSKSAENGFYELIAEIDDSRIESGQQLSVTFEKEGFEKQEHRLLTTEESVNLDVKLKTAPPPVKKPFNWLPVIIAGGAVILLLIIGIVVLLLIKPKTPEITSFSADPNTIELGQSATLIWKIKNASSAHMLIDQNMVPVAWDGNRQVQPTQTTEYKLIAKGKKGEEIPKSVVVEVKDVVPPELTVTLSPSEPTSAENVIFTANATDSGGISKIEILVNDKMVKECAESPCTYEGGPYPLGSLSYKARAWDNSNNETTAGPESIKILDAGAPDVTVDHSPSTPNTKEKVTFTASASDPGGISKVQIFVNGEKVEECTGSPCKYIGGPYPLGSVSYDAYAWDMSDNEGTAGPKSISISDIGAPDVTITHSPSKPNTKEKITFTATAMDDTGISKVRVYVENEKVKECTGSPCKYVGGPYPLGSVRYEAYAWDKSNNKGVSGSKSLTTSDIGAPEVTISSTPSSPTTEERVTFTASASDPGGIDRVQIFVNGEKVEECTGSPCKYVGGPYPLGSVSYEAYAWDKSDNKGIAGPKSLTTRDMEAPEVTISSTPSTPAITEKVTFTASALDPGGINTVQIFVNDKKVEECTKSPCTYVGGPYPLGSVSYEAHAWDKSNNKGVSGMKSFTTRDTGAPDVAISTDPTAPTADDKVTFTATAADETGISKVQIYVKGEKVKECTESPCIYEGGPYSLGSVSYEARAWDKSGNKAIAGPDDITIKDIREPDITITHSPISPTIEDKVTVTAKASDPGGISKVTILVNDEMVKECTESPCTYEGGPYSLGNVNYEAHAWDNTENEAVAGPDIIKIGDDKAPNVTIIHKPEIPTIEEKVIFTATATDPGGINKIEILVNGAGVVECTESPCSYEGGAYSLGSVSYEAYAWDESGNRATSGPKSFETKDIKAPMVIITHSPASPTISQKVAFTAAAEDESGINKVRILINGTEVKECAESPCSYEGGPYSLGKVSYEAHAWDKADNEGTTGPKSFSPEDDEAPDVTVTHSPLTPTIKQKVTFTVKATDPGGLRNVQIQVNGKTEKSCTGSPCSYEGGPYPRPLEKVSYRALASDTSGNEGVDGPKSFSPRDVEGPEVHIGLNPLSPTTKQKVTFTATAKDPGGLSNVQIRVKGKIEKSCTGSPCSYEGGPYPLGRVSYEARATDRSGFTTVAGPESFSPRDVDPPSVTVTHSPASPTTKDKVTFSANASDASGIKNVRIYINNTIVRNCSGSSCTYVPPNPYPPGTTVRYEAHAWDGWNNVGKTGSKGFRPRDIDPPIVYISPNLASPNSTQKITFTASARDASGIKNLQIYVNNVKVKECSGSASCTTALLGPYAPGKISYYAYAYDNSNIKGGTGSKSLTIADKTPPSVNIATSPFTVNINDPVTFTATASDSGGISKIRIYVNNNMVRDCPNTTTCKYSRAAYKSVQTVTYYAYAWDKANNWKKTGVEKFTVMNYNFETGNLVGWQPAGSAFKYQPTLGDNTKARRQLSSGLQGKYWIGTFEKYNQAISLIRLPFANVPLPPGQTQGDGPTGTLTSYPFYIKSSKASFLIGGGSSTSLGVSLIVGGRTRLTARGKNSEAMTRVTWDLTSYVGQYGKLVIFDNSSGGWGHVNFDDFQFTSPFRFGIAPLVNYPLNKLDVYVPVIK